MWALKEVGMHSHKQPEFHLPSEGLPCVEPFKPTHHQDGSVPVGSFDALALWDTGIDGRLVTSPNMTHVPEFPVLDYDGVYIRSDGSWGPHDYTRWPQAYSSSNLHHLCIPKLPALQSLLNENNPYSKSLDAMVWNDLEESMWVKTSSHRLSTGNILEAGQLRQDMLDILVKNYHLFKHRAIQRYTTTEFKDALDYKLVETISGLGDKVIERLRSVSEPFYGTRSTVRELQRLTLELVGFINLVTDVRPRLRNPTIRSSDVFPYRGAFCVNEACLQDLYRVGIPVWYIRHLSTMSPSSKIFNVVQPIPLSSCLAIDRPRLLGTIVRLGDIPINVADFRSPGGNIIPDPAMTDLLRAMRFYSRADETEPRRIAPPTTSISVPPSNALQSVAASQSTSRKRMGHNDASSKKANKRQCTIDDGAQSHAPSGSLLFVIPDGLVPGQRNLPPIARHWLKAVTDVGLLAKRKPTVTAKYLHPPPFLFSHPNADRVCRYYHNYVRIERFLRHRIKEGSLFGDQHYTIKQWRDILHGDYIQSKDIDPASSSSVIRTLNPTLPSPKGLTAEMGGSTRLHDRKKRGKRAEVRVTLGVQGDYPPYEPQLVCKWWLTGQDVSLQDIKLDRRLRESVLWDVHGTGFILDLWTIDFELVPRTSLSPSQAGDRHILLASVYGGVVEGRQYKIAPSGMKSVWTDSPDIKALDSLVRVVRDWPNCPKFIAEADVLTIGSRTRDLVYERLTAFFVRTCIDVHDRLPVIPCYLD